MAPNKSTKNKIVNVRIADPDGASESIHVDRMISAIRQSESQIRVLVGENVFLDNAATPVSGIVGFDTVFSSDDYGSIVAQYNEFRIKAFKFDVYDVNVGNVGGAMFSTFHDIYQNTPLTYTFAQVVDGPDAKAVPPGTGKASFYWLARGVKENEFQSSASGTFSTIIDRMGGLRYYINSGASPGAKFQIVTHAIVDFRGRR